MFMDVIARKMKKIFIREQIKLWTRVADEF
jgi:hypothetical protein